MSSKVDDRLARLEAILYASGRPLSLATIVAHLKLENEQEAKALTMRLGEIYEQDRSPLEVRYLPEDRVVIQLKTDYTKEARKFSIRPLLRVGPLRTLSYIAYNQPIEQKEVALARGSQSYQHIKQLVQLGFVQQDKGKGRAKLLRTTNDFADALGISRDHSAMKRQLRSLFNKLETEAKKGSKSKK